MSKFRPFDYLTDKEKKEVLKYEALLQAASTVKEFIEVERILKEYRSLGIRRRQLDDIANQHSRNTAIDEDEESSNNRRMVKS